MRHAAVSIHATGMQVGTPIPSLAVPLDLIFNILITPDNTMTYQLHDSQFTICLGDADRVAEAHEKLPLPTVLPCSATCISYSLVQFESEGSALCVQLQNRCRTGQALVSKLLGMSFMLNIMNPNAYGNDTEVWRKYVADCNTNSYKTWFKLASSADSSQIKEACHKLSLLAFSQLSAMRSPPCKPPSLYEGN